MTKNNKYSIGYAGDYRKEDNLVGRMAYQKKHTFHCSRKRKEKKRKKTN